MTRVNEHDFYVCDLCDTGSISQVPDICNGCGADMTPARFVRASEQYDEPVIFQAEPPAEIVEAVTRWLSICAQSDDDLIARCIQAWPNVAIGDLVRAVSRARDLTKGE